jgi:hypothetical protein
MMDTAREEAYLEELLRRAEALKRATKGAGYDDSVLPLPPGADRRTIMREFRKWAKVHHPDHGGDAEAFGRLCAAKDAALSMVST